MAGTTIPGVTSGGRESSTSATGGVPGGAVPGMGNAARASVGASHVPAAPAPGVSGPGTLSGHSKIVCEAFTFDDVLILPRYSAIVPADTDVSARLTRAIALNVPLLSAPMDTVTESSLAIALAQEGGLGIIHRNLPPEEQAREVVKVKRSANGVITDPLTLSPTDTVGRARELMQRYNVSGFPVTEGGAPKGKIAGILTRRDLKFVEDERTPVAEVMTIAGLVTAPASTTLEQAASILNKNKVEKLLLIDAGGNLSGLITMRDIDRLSQFPRACIDARGRLRCGAAVGVDQYERAEALIRAEADVIVVDTSHGHSENVLRTVREIKERWGIEVIAGNVATAEAARALIEAGADAVKAGIGPGSICTTRVVTGVGVPQLTAVMNAVEGARGTGAVVIADGGIRQSGDIAKAIAAGAGCVMMGSLLAGLDESPGEMVIRHGRRYKSYRGMGSEGAMRAGSGDRYGQGSGASGGGGASGSGGGGGSGGGSGTASRKYVPEGVEGLVAYRGPLAEFVYQMVGGLRASMGYCGCRTIDEFQREARFVKVTAATVVENHPHDIRITKESSNYISESAGE